MSVNILRVKEIIWAALQAAYLVNFNWKTEAVKSISKFIFLKVNCYEKVNKHDCIRKWSSWNKIINLITIRVKNNVHYILSSGGILLSKNPGIILLLSLLNFLPLFLFLYRNQTSHTNELCNAVNDRFCILYFIYKS